MWASITHRFRDGPMNGRVGPFGYSRDCAKCGTSDGSLAARDGCPVVGPDDSLPVA